MTCRLRTTEHGTIKTQKTLQVIKFKLRNRPKALPMATLLIGAVLALESWFSSTGPKLL